MYLRYPCLSSHPRPQWIIENFYGQSSATALYLLTKQESIPIMTHLSTAVLDRQLKLLAIQLSNMKVKIIQKVICFVLGELSCKALHRGQTGRGFTNHSKHSQSYANTTSVRLENLSFTPHLPCSHNQSLLMCSLLATSQLCLFLWISQFFVCCINGVT